MPLWNHLICFQATAAAGIPSPSVVCCMYTRSTPSSVTYGCLIHDEPVQGAKTHCPQNLFTDLQSDSLASKPIFIIKKNHQNQNHHPWNSVGNSTALQAQDKSLICRDFMNN